MVSPPDFWLFFASPLASLSLALSDKLDYPALMIRFLASIFSTDRFLLGDCSLLALGEPIFAAEVLDWIFLTRTCAGTELLEPSSYRSRTLATA